MQDNERRMIADLAKGIGEFEKAQNNIRISEFMEYSPLFIAKSVETMTDEQLKDLSAKFFARFSLYKPISIYDEEGELIFRVPQMFIPIQEVSPSLVNVVNKFRSQGKSEIPKYASEAVSGLLSALFKSQEDVSEYGFATRKEYIEHLRSEYANDIVRFEALRQGGVPDDGSVSPTARNEPLGNPDSVDGISWDD